MFLQPLPRTNPTSIKASPHHIDKHVSRLCVSWLSLRHCERCSNVKIHRALAGTRDDGDEKSDIEHTVHLRFAKRGSHPGLLCFNGETSDAPTIPAGFGLSAWRDVDLRSFYNRRLNLSYSRRRYNLWRPVPEAGLVLDGAVTPEVARRWAIQIAEAMEFVHSCGVLHNHLDSGSILLASTTHPRRELQPRWPTLCSRRWKILP
jgi:hypothetical protein